MASNESIPFYEPAGALTFKASGAVTGCRFLKVGGNRDSGPGLNTAVTGGNYVLAHADAAGYAVGVSAYDVANGAKGKAWLQPGIIVPVDAGADIAAGAEVEVGTDGKAVPLNLGKAVGRAMTGATSGGKAEICLYGTGIAIPTGG